MRKSFLIAVAAFLAMSGAALAAPPVVTPAHVEVGTVLNGGGIQANVATVQAATTNLSNIGVGKAEVNTVAVGNSLTGTADTINTSLGLNGIVQVDAIALQTATTNVSNVGAGSLDVTTAAVGNNVSLNATKEINANPIQVNALTAQIATTNLSQAGIGNLSVTTQAIGNAASFSAVKASK